jgi:hypothetical protein
MTRAIDQVPDNEKLDVLARELGEQADRIGGAYPHLRRTLNKHKAALPAVSGSCGEIPRTGRQIAGFGCG